MAVAAVLIAPNVYAASMNSGTGSMNKDKQHSIIQLLEDRKGERPFQMVEINSQGKAMIRGGVESVNGNTLIIKSWGGSWTVLTSAATKFTPKGMNGTIGIANGKAIVGDVNGDGTVDKKDYAFLQINFGRTKTDGVISLSTFDLNGDGMINDIDMKLFLEQLDTKALNSKADFNDDGFVNVADQTLITAALYTKVQNISFSDVDITRDGKINLDDFSQLSANFGTGATVGSPITKGDFVAVHGMIVSGSAFTINASEVRNWSREGNLKIEKKELKNLKKLEKKQSSTNDED